MAISAKDVQALRQKTGVGMMECKKALEATNGDFEEAIKFLREKGIAVAAKKADRIAAEGVVDIMKSEDGLTTVMIEVNAETDFVAKNAGFQEFVKGVLRTILANKPANIEELNALPYDGTELTVEAEVKNQIFKIGENISVRRFLVVEGVTGTYIHGNGITGVIVVADTCPCNKDNAVVADVTKNCCLQIAAMAPIYLDKESVPASAIDAEKEILMTQIKNDPSNAKKPENIIEKMVIGRISKYYDTNCLLEQDYVKDDSMKVGKYVEAAAKEAGIDLKIKAFYKYEKGEGIQKREDDFAAEIDKLVKGSN